MNNDIFDVLLNYNPLIKKNIKRAKSSFNGQFNSLYEWLNTDDLNQSGKIKSGIELNTLIKTIVERSPHKALLIKDNMIQISSSKNKEADILFSLSNIIFYREIKGNIQLDSEKMPATLVKINDINNKLTNLYSNHQINGKLFCPAHIKSHNGIEGFNDFIQLLGYNYLSLIDYCNFGKKFGEMIRTKLIG